MASKFSTGENIMYAIDGMGPPCIYQGLSAVHEHGRGENVLVSQFMLNVGQRSYGGTYSQDTYHPTARCSLLRGVLLRRRWTGPSVQYRPVFLALHIYPPNQQPAIWRMLILNSSFEESNSIPVVDERIATRVR